jgi:hypothetical protein
VVLIHRLCLWTAIAAFVWWPASPASSSGPGPVLTQHNDNGRTGAYLSETVLNPSNVNVAQFGKLFTRPVDGQIYAQPLYMPGLAVAGGIHNVVFVATMHNSVYAFDADHPAASAPLWQASLGAAAPITYTIPNTTTVGHDFGPPGYPDIAREVGALSTPVIDPNTKTLYAVAFTKEPDPPTCPCRYAYRLHALDLATGAEKLPGPVTISGTVPGDAEDAVDGLVSFQSQQQLQRAGLLLSDGVVYIAFASYGDWAPYHGWLFGYDAATLRPVAVWNSTPNSGLGGIWQSGQGPAADADGNIYLMTGNGRYSNGTGDYGDSFVKLNPHAAISGTLPVTDTFTPYDQSVLEAHDFDLGSGGPMLIPGRQLLLGGGKSGILYLLSQADMGGYEQGPGDTDRVVQSFQATITNAVASQGTPVFWNSPSGSRIYQWGTGEAIEAYSLTVHSSVSATIAITPVATGTTQLPPHVAGGFLSLSANDSAAGTGIVWAVHRVYDPIYSVPQGVLRAYDAADVSHELWNSTQYAARDSVGNFAKFNVPTVANGRVYVASFSNQLDVYGIMDAPWVITQPLGQAVNGGHRANLSVVVSGQSPLTYQWYRGASGDTQSPVGTNSSSYTTPPLGLPTRYWVRASNGQGHIDSATAVISLPNSIYLPVIFGP